MLHLRRKKRGLSLVEMLVVTALMSIVSAFTIVLYSTGVGDFESSSTTTSMVRHARKVSQKVALIVSTATNRTETAGTFANTTVDNLSLGTGSGPSTAINFLSTGNFIKTSVSECAYAFDDGDTVIPGYTPLYRYQIAWSGAGGAGTIPPNCLYLQRQTIVPNASGIPLDTRGVQMIGTYRQNLGNNIGECGFQYALGNMMQLRLKVNSIDPVTGRGIDGQLMRTMTKRRRKDVNGTDKSFELLTSIPVPTSSIK